MTQSWGPGVTRFLPTRARQFAAVVWRDDQPPLDSEMNLTEEIQFERLADVVRGSTPSGFFLDPTRDSREDYVFSPSFANQFLLAPPRGTGDDVEKAPGLVANVNGWIVPIVGTASPEGGGEDSPANRVRLYPPPSSGGRTDLVFLEVWKAVVESTPSVTNKPSADTIWPFGNVEYGGAAVEDDLEDGRIGVPTSARVQIQYRIRVFGSGTTGIDLVHYPDGITDPVVRARGAAASVSSFPFENMRRELGDPSLWRAGDGDPDNSLRTVDGYVYALPIAVVSRRNSDTYSAVRGSSPNTNGAPERTPSSRFLSDPRTGARTLTSATLSATLSPTATGYVSLSGYGGSGLGDANLFPLGTTRRFLEIGEGVDRETVSIVPNTDPTGHPNQIFIEVIGRGRGGSTPRAHVAGSVVRLYSDSPERVYSDEIRSEDLVDLRRAVTLGDWDYSRLLANGVGSLLRRTLRTSAKTSGTGGNTFGPVTAEVSYLQAPGALPSPAPSGVDLVDGPDGIRTVWSDAAAVQGDVTVLLDHLAPLSAGFTASTFDSTVSGAWTVGADFQPRGWLNALGANTGWTNGSIVFFYLGGTSGSDGARAGIVGGARAVRFLAPRETALAGRAPGDGAGHSTPWRVRFLGGESGNDAGTTGSVSPAGNAFRAGRITGSPSYGETTVQFPGAMYPVETSNFERPFVVLGGVLHPALVRAGVAATSANFTSSGSVHTIRVPGLNFDTFALALGPDRGTLRDYLTANGADFTGRSSRLYVISYGDAASLDNNGAFRVIGAGTESASGGPYTENTSASTNGLIVEPLSADFSAFANSVGRTVTLEFRSQTITASDDAGTGAAAGVALVFTDLSETAPWSEGESSLRIERASASPYRLVPIASKAVVTMDVMWDPGRGSSTRVPDRVSRLVAKSSSASLLRTPVSAIDPGFASDTGYPTGERVFTPAAIQLWNRLSSLGEGESLAPDHGGRIVGLTEQDRERELFVDPGSKTILFRPYTLRKMVLKGFLSDASPSLLGALTYVGGVTVKDGAAVWTTGLGTGYAVPSEYMPRFGRQDIPYHRSTGPGDPLLPGINHLFADSADLTDPVFYVIGGEDNPGPAGTRAVYSSLYATGPLSYCLRGTVGGSPHVATGARKCFYEDVVSTDLGAGLRGIELPPYQGIARLYGVYERNDFLAHLDPTYAGGFQADRVTPIASPPKNLLRKDGENQTLFIRRGGGNDVTGQLHSHTYVVPESALDLTLIPGFVPGSNTFAQYEYVVECVGFGFAEGFIDRNNFVLSRRHSGTGVAVIDGDNLELSGASMILPSAVSRGDPLYQVYSRTVYQGDPYYTRSGSAPNASDYEARYGRVSNSDAFELSRPIQQFNPTTGAMTVERPNARSLEILASMDLYTTLGTGKIGGKMYPGTILDSGYLDSANTNRLPEDPAAPPLATRPRAFTAGQSGNPNRARIEFEFLNLTLATVAPKLKIRIGGSGLNVSLTGGDDFGGSSLEQLASNFALAVNATAAFRGRVSATSYGPRVVLESVLPGAIGNGYYVEFTPSVFPVTLPAGSVSKIVRLADYRGAAISSRLTRANFLGGLDLPRNAGTGNSAISLAGLTERFPLGILASDSDFLTENPLGDAISFLRASPGGFRALYNELPLTRTGEEYSSSLGEPGGLLALSDGSVLEYVPYTDSTPSGTRSFRLYRGGGAAFVLNGPAPGGPVTWVGEAFPPALGPILKGAILSVKALLVRNFPEEAFGGAVSGRVRSEGDEIQMVLLTHTIYGGAFLSDIGLVLGGSLSPTGYGEGYAAADRYLLPGRPMYGGKNRRTPDPNLDPAPYVST